MKTTGRIAAALLTCAALFTTTIGTASAADLDEPRLKDIAMQIVSSAENSSTDWKAQFGYIEDIDDGRDCTAGIIGFRSGTGDMLDLVELYKRFRAGPFPGDGGRAVPCTSPAQLPDYTGLDLDFTDDPDDRPRG